MSKGMDLRNLDTKNPGNWPVPVKLAACVLADRRHRRPGLVLRRRRQAHRARAAGSATEQTLRAEFEDKQGRAANLEPLKQQLAQMELMLQQMLRQLPSKNEMPDLIVDVSQTALATGISNELFQPGPETQKEFYAEKPITLRMVGTYHQFGAFVSGVASLPRVVIMTMHNISLTPRAGRPGSLVLEGTIRTYRYLDDEEIAARQPRAAAGGSK